ncbi:MAG: hypothetical protein ABEJ74_01900 [Haloferacaceae archaeon]
MTASRTLPRRAYDWLRQPEYTGPNRCLACTAVNLVIALALAAAVATVSLGTAIVALAVAVGLIALRGYLIPGTPTLTRRYLPDSVLALFDKAPRRRDGAVAEVDVEAYLLSAGVLVDDPDDLTVDPAFERAWIDRIAAVDVTAPNLVALGELLEVDPDRLAASYFDDGACTVYLDGEWLGQWESAAAFAADVAASTLLEEREPTWASLSMAARSEVLAGLRLCLERCPACAGVVSLRQDVVESCCRSTDVVVAACGDCETVLFEVEYAPALAHPHEG